MSFSVISDLFVPSSRHTEEERERPALTRDEEGSADPARGPIDLDSGTVLVQLPRGRGGAKLS